MARARILAAGAAVALFCIAGPVAALSSLDAVAASLRQSPVYNDPDAQRPLTPVEETRLVEEVTSAGTPIFIAVTASSFARDNGGSADAALSALARAVGKPGAYALVSGNSFRANSTLFPVNDIASRAVAANQGGTSYDVLSTFVAGVSDRAANGGGGGSGGLPWGWLLLGGGAVGAGGLVIYGRRKSQQRAAEQLAAVRKVVDEDVTAFGEQLADFDISDARLDDAGRADLTTALDQYAQASDASDAMTSPAHAGRVTAHLEDGRFALACVQARLDGRPLPERRPPCFFDPRHGPSASDVAWAPPGGQSRDVPACAGCVAALERGRVPASREVPVGDGTAPYWQAGPGYGAYAGGYYSSFGSILPQIMIGTMLGNALFPSMGGGLGGAVDQAGIGGGDVGGGDVGGGGFGGFDGGGFGDFSGGSGGGDF